MIKMHIIASGSKGNCAIIYDENTKILVDLGITKARLVEGLNEINLSIEDIDFALFTHDHTDHISNEKILNSEKKYAIRWVLDLKEDNFLKLFKEYKFKSFNVIPLETSHDATASCGFLFKNGNEELVYITDTGVIPFSTLDYIMNKDYYFIECNHDIEMLLNSSRPTLLKERILSNRGHLSNEQCVYYLDKIIGNKTKKIILAHISEECNSTNKILKVFEEAASKNEIFSKVEIKLAYQHYSIDL